jgi:hypothetical protein
MYGAILTGCFLLVVAGGYADPRQWPTKPLAPELLPGKPWHDARDYPGLQGLISSLQRAFPRLRDEYAQIKAAGDMQRQNECLHDAAGGSWSYGAVFGVDSVAAVREGECARNAPVACSLLTMARMQLGSAGGPTIKRIGYSAVEPGAHIRPHCGGASLSSCSCRLLSLASADGSMRARVLLPCSFEHAAEDSRRAARAKG